MRRLPTLRLVVIATMTAMLGVAAQSAPGVQLAAFALPGGSIAVTPNSGLTDGQIVSVEGTGWSPGATVGYCQGVSIDPADPSNCNGGSYSTVTADNAGTFTVAVTLTRIVYIPRLGVLLDCADPATQCVIGAADVGDVVNTVALAPITFAAAPPTAPMIGVVVAGNGEATVSWTAPTFDGGSPVTGYVVTPYIVDTPQPPQGFPTSTTTETVTGLTNGVTYRFGVQAMNAVGTGASSSLSDAVTPGTPGPPTIGTAVAGDGQATLFWTAPTVDNGSSITGYAVTPSIDGVAQPPVTFDSTATTQTVTGLVNGVAYTFTVAAINAFGTGPESPSSNPVTPAPTAPDPPTILRNATAANQSATISWLAPASDGGSPIIGYVVTAYVGYAPVTWRLFNSTLTTQTVTGLTNGTQYRFRVRAYNAIGFSDYSKVTNPVTPSA
jgi:Fibronectin type III domain/Neocarzinostatin family